MRIAHILHEYPYPPNHGISCDIARRGELLASLGHEVFAVSWVTAAEEPSPENLARIAPHVVEHALIRIGADAMTKARRLWNLRRYPSYVASRIPPRAEREALIARIAAFVPDLVWLEGVHPAWLALELQARLGVKLAYRSHNIEHLYLAEQARLSPSLKQRMALKAGTLGLERIERAVFARADHVFDISSDDLRFWRDQGFARISWLPSPADPAILDTIGGGARPVDLLFLGSLSSPNNIAGLRWFLAEPWPLIRAALPDAALTIAGRAPPTALVREGEAAGAIMLANPPEAAPLFASARVMINPILHGSGINVKTIDMLASGQPVVTTPKGARGLSSAVVEELRIADGAEAFAEAAIAAIRETRTEGASRDRRALIDAVFGQQAMADALKAIAP